MLQKGAVKTFHFVWFFLNTPTHTYSTTLHYTYFICLILNLETIKLGNGIVVFGFGREEIYDESGNSGKQYQRLSCYTLTVATLMSDVEDARIADRSRDT